MFFRAWHEMQGGNMPTPAEYVKKFCEVNHLDVVGGQQSRIPTGFRLEKHKSEKL